MRRTGRGRRLDPCWPLLATVLVAGCAAGTTPADPPSAPPSTSTTASAPPSVAPSAASASTPPAGPVPDEARAAATAFVAFADGTGPEVPWGASVRYVLNGQRVATFERREIVDPGAWGACLPGTTTVEGRDCPVSVLATVAEASQAGELPLEPRPPRVVGCTRAAPLELDRAVESVTIRQRTSERSCFGDFAATLLLDRRGRVVAVDFVLSGP